MKYRSLGHSGIKVSVIGLGTNQFGGKVDQEGVNAIIAKALDLGITMIDTADIYQQGRSEESLGIALRGCRDQVVLATKAFFPTGEGPNERGASRYHLTKALEASLRRLQTDVIDLYQVHRWDDATPIEETLRTLDDLVRQGKVRYIGASNFATWQLARANLIAEFRGWTSFVTIQPHYHMLERDVEREMLPFCDAHRVGILPYFPLAGGFLTGKYRQGEPIPAGSRGETSSYVQKYMNAENYARIERLGAWAAVRGHTLGDLAHAWLLGHPSVCSVISGATRPEHIELNAAGGDWELSPDDMAEISAILDASE